MKHLSIPTVLAVMLALSAPANAAPDAVEFQLDENYAELEPAAGDGTDEVDHNMLDGVTDAEDAPVAKAAEAEPAKPVAAPKSIVVKQTESATEKPAPKVVKKEPVARDIPLIETDNPAESSPDVNYVTGGIGEDERQSIEAAKPDYNLHVMSASVNGAFVGDARVIITRKNGDKVEEVLNVVAGPLLYVKLPAGTYALDATLGEQKKHQNFTVGKKGASNIHLGWKVPANVTY